jgi:copper(I)-binding protein
LPAGLLLLGLLLVNAASATEAEHIRASQAWLRVLPGDLPAGAYVTLENSSDQPATLKSANSPAYTEVMLHHSSGNGGMSRMTMVDSLTIPAHSKLMLAPAGYHLMLAKAVHPVKPGDTVTLNLIFADGSKLATKFVARPANAIDASH